MKKLFTLLLFAALLCGLCIVGFAEEKEEFYRSLLNIVPTRSYSGNPETVATAGYDIWALLSELDRVGLISRTSDRFSGFPDEEEIFSTCQSFSLADLYKTFERLYGPGSSSALGIDKAKPGMLNGTGSELLYLSNDKQTVYYVPCSYGGGDFTVPYGKLIRSEVVGEDLCLYVRMVYTSLRNDTVFYLHETCNFGSYFTYWICNKISDGDVNPWKLLENGDLDEYLPIYKHTFKPNGDGSYYWASTVKEADSKPVPMSVYIPSFPDDIVPDEFLSQIPGTAYSGERETIKTVEWGSTTDRSVGKVLIDELLRVELIPKDVPKLYDAPTEAELAACPRVSVEDVSKTFNRLFGPNASDLLKDQKFLGGDVSSLQLTEDGKNYIYVPYAYGGGDGCAWRDSILSFEVVGQDIVITSRYAKYAAPSFGGFFVYGTTKNQSSAEILLDTVTGFDSADPSNPLIRFEKGEFDEYLPIYEHVFKSNGDGTYYWESTVKASDGRKIPFHRVFPEVSYSFKANDVNKDTLMQLIPHSAYSGKEETIQTVDWGDDTGYGVARILFIALAEDRYISQRETGAGGTRVVATYVNNTFDRLFGPGASAKLQGVEQIGNARQYMKLLSAGKAYQYYRSNNTESSGRNWYMSHIKTETSGKDIVIYTYFAEIAVANRPRFWILDACKLEGNTPNLLGGVDSEGLKGEQNPWDRLKKGAFDKYLPIYKHTFRCNEDGVYYWASTVKEADGKQIPVSVIDPSAKEENTDTSTATDASTGTVTDAVPDVSTGSATDVVPQEEGSSAVWIVVAVVAVAAVAAVAVFFVLKKKKA